MHSVETMATLFWCSAGIGAAPGSVGVSVGATRRGSLDELDGSMPAVGLEVRTQGETVVVHVVGALDVRSHEALLAALSTAVDLGRGLVVLDLERCDFVGHHQFEAVQEAAGRLVALGSELVVRRPPASFTLIGLVVGAMPATLA